MQRWQQHSLKDIVAEVSSVKLIAELVQITL